jgi:hypothetical protein
VKAKVNGLEEPEAFNAAVLEFVRGLRPGE